MKYHPTLLKVLAQKTQKVGHRRTNFSYQTSM